MIVDNYHCRHIDAHYMSEKKQAVAYLFATGAKALVIMAQRAKHIDNNCNENYNDVFHGPNTEAKLKIEIINEEKIRNIKRKICENKPIEVIKYSRKGQTRKILLKIKHNKSQILFVWKSKTILGLKFKKNFSVDKNKHIGKWMLTSNDDDDGDSNNNEDNNHENDDYNNDPGNNDQNKYREDIDNNKTTNAILSLSPMVSNTKNIDNNCINGNNQYKHQQQHHQHHHHQQYSNCINDDNMILPFLRFENNKRILDIQFMDFCEMKACLELIVNNPSVTVCTSLMN